MSERFSGVHWMLATPFDEDENVDPSSIVRLMDKAESSGCSGVVCLGVTGEAARMTDDERRLVASQVIEHANGMPVTVGTTAASTKACITYSREAEKLGAAAVMVAAPAMAKSNVDVLFNHFQRVAESVSIPVVMQDYPQASGVQMPTGFIARVGQEIPNVQYLKLEDPPTPNKITAIRKLIEDKLTIFGGLGGVFLLDELSRGSVGAMTGFAYPEVLVEICTNMREGGRASVEPVFNRYLPMLLFEYQEGIGLGIRKHALHHRGLISCPRVRYPGSELTEEIRQEFLDLIRDIDYD